MKKGNRCSLQSHQTKLETIYVVTGKMRYFEGTSPSTLEERIHIKGDCFTVAPGLIHRMEALEDCLYLEASTPELDDVIRLEDDYNRK